MGKIPEETIEQIAAANDIADVIGGYIPLKRAGSNFRALCPFHQEKTPSFNVNPSRQSYHCFGCGAGGTVFRFVMAYENIDFPSAVRKLAERAGITIVESDFDAAEDSRSKLRRRLLALHQQAAAWFHQNLMRTAAAQSARDYLKSRGLNSDVAKAWKIGYAPDSWDALGTWGQAEGFTAEELIASGLVTVKSEDQGQPSSRSRNQGPRFYDRFRDRVMFPICNERSEVIAFTGRVLQPDAKAAKYVNSPETMLFIKSDVLFGLHKSKRALLDKGVAIVCEGQIDLISAFEAGVQNVIASQGTAFTEKQAHILKRHVEEVVLCFDADNAGQKATERSLASLLAENVIVRVAEMPPGHDPDSLIRAEGPEAFANRIAAARDFFDFQIERSANNPEFGSQRGKMQFARKMAASVSLITDPVMRETVINKISLKLEIPANDFRAMLAKGRKTFQRESSRLQENEESPAQLKPLKLIPTISLLCLLALRHAASRDWLRAKPWREVLEGVPDSELLGRILEQEIRPEDNSSISSFMSTLNPVEEAAISSLLLDKLPANPEVVLQDCWNDLRKRGIRRRLEILTARIRNAPFEEATKLQKEVLDLTTELTDITRPFSSTKDNS